MLVSSSLDIIATDILGPFPESSWGNNYVLAVTNYFTKWIEIFAVPDKSAMNHAEVSLDEIIGCCGCPYDIHFNQSWNYKNIIFTDLCPLLET